MRAGLAFAVLFAAGAVVAGGDLPGPHASAREVAGFYVEHHDRLQVAAVLLGLGLVCLVALVADVARQVATSAPEHEAAARFAVASVAAFAATVGLGVVALQPAATFHAA